MGPTHRTATCMSLITPPLRWSYCSGGSGIFVIFEAPCLVRWRVGGLRTWGDRAFGRREP
jgi:hypothetical protein